MNILMLFKITELKILFNNCANKNKKYILLIGIARKALINDTKSDNIDKIYGSSRTHLLLQKSHCTFPKRALCILRE